MNDRHLQDNWNDHSEESRKVNHYLRRPSNLPVTMATRQRPDSRNTSFNNISTNQN